MVPAPFPQTLGNQSRRFPNHFLKIQKVIGALPLLGPGAGTIRWLKMAQKGRFYYFPWVALIVAVGFVLVVLGFRYWTSARVAKTSVMILNALRESGRPANVSELVQLTGRNSGFVINGISFLEKRLTEYATQLPPKV